MNIKKKITITPLKVKNNQSDKELEPFKGEESYYLVEILPGLFIAGEITRLCRRQQLEFASRREGRCNRKFVCRKVS